MKTLSLVFSFFAISIVAQSRVLYEYTFAKDSTKVDSLKSEWMYLDIGQKGSSYYSKQTFESDSISLASVRKQIQAGSMSISITKKNPGEIKFKVEKTYPDYKVHLLTPIGSDSYRVEEDRELKWKILPDKMKIGAFDVQKATTEFAGRHWEVWFTMEVPIQDGPYKFHGLPGLIVKATDRTGTHTMELKAIKPLPASQQKEGEKGNSEMSARIAPRKQVEVNRDQYRKQLEQYRKDPAKSMRETLGSANSSVTLTINGVKHDQPNDIIRQIEKQAKERMKNNNNPIELVP